MGGVVVHDSGVSCSPLHVQDGETALFIASRKGHDQIVELLLRREADVNHHTKVSLFMLACVCVCVCVCVCDFFQCQEYMHNHENKCLCILLFSGNGHHITLIFVTYN